MSGRRSSAPQRARGQGWVRAVPILAAVVVGAASFTLSFFAQAEVSAELGAVPAQWSWLVPIIVDGGVLAGSASVWSSSTRQARKDPVAYLTIVALLALSVIVNVHHAANSGGVLGAVIAGAPPVVLLLCLELVAAQARRDAVEAQAVEVAEQLPDVAPAAAAPAPVEAAVPAPAPARIPAQPVPVQPRATLERPQWAPAVAVSVPAAMPATHVTERVSDADLPRATTAERPVPAPSVAPAVATGLVNVPAVAPAAPVGPAREQRPASQVTGQPAGSPAPGGEPDGADSGRPGSQAEQIRAMFTEHLAAGGDPKDTALARHIAETLQAPVPSVRKVLAAARKDHELVIA